MTRDARRVLLGACLVLLSIVGAASAFAAVEVPALHARVTDLTHTLTPTQTATLEQTLQAFEERKGAQIAVLMLPTTDGEPLGDYSMRVVEAWKLGRKGVDDGVLFIIAKDDHEMRIEVGYGLEGALTDVQSKRIIRDVVTPYFKQGEFYLGIVAGTDRIMSAIAGEPLPEPTVTQRARRPGSDIGSLLPVLLVVTLVIGGILRAIFGRLGGAALASVATAFIVWLLVGTLFVAIIVAVVAFLMTLLGGGGSGWGGRGGWGGGFGGGGFGGGFSGGGGGFGGGGASGRW